MKHRSPAYRRWIRRLALGFAVAAVAAPSALAAGQYPSMEQLEQFSFTPQSAVATLPTMEQLEQFSFTPEPVAPSGLPTLDELSKFRFTPSDEPVGPTTPTASLPTLDELSKFRFTPQTPETPAATPVVEAPGIDWTDAGIGAGIAIGAMLLAVAAALSVRHQHHRGRLAH
jgi:hypothetical protein